MNIFDLLLSWHGRIGRVTHVVTVICLSIVQTLIFAALGLGLSSDATTGVIGGLGLMALIVWVAFAWCFWMVSIKRAHDLGKSGWWVFGWSMAFLPAAALLGLGTTEFAAGSRMAFQFAGFALCIGMFWNLFIRLFFFAGTPGANPFGPPPNTAQAIFNDEYVSDLPPARAPATHPLDRVAADRVAVASMQPVAVAKAAPGSTRKPNIVAKPGPSKPAGFGKRGLRPA